MIIHRIAAFTENGKGGNPAGVALLDTLPAAQTMQETAAQVGYSETAFAARQSDGSWRVRYFSPLSEVPFCGHATIALGAVLAESFGPETYALSLNDAQIKVDTKANAGAFEVTILSPPTHSHPAPKDLTEPALALFGLTEDDLDPDLPMMFVHGGANHLTLPLASRKTLAEMSYDLETGRALMIQYDLITIALIHRTNPRQFEVRNAFASGGVLEDPATGAAAAGLGGMLRDQGHLSGGKITLLQGFDMGRPSRITVDISGNPGDLVKVSGMASHIS